MDIPRIKTGSVDSLLANYIANAPNELIKMARRDKLSEVYLYDRTENTDTADYLVFQIGHDLADAGDQNKRFITDVWVYVDSTKNRLYEYDLPNDSLTVWKH